MLTKAETNIIETDVQAYCIERKSIRKRTFLCLKRIFDIAASLAGLLVLSPIYLLTAAAVKAEDGGPVFYRQERIGQNGESFYIYKFRSMKVHAEQLETMLSKEQLEQYYKDYKLDEDPRITKVGDFIRRSSIDELPQLYNILRGEMSFVGPRPVLMRETLFYGENRDKFLSVRPGLTGYWQVYARNNADYKSGKRQQMELYYIDHMGVWQDLKILCKTAGAVMRKTGR